MTTEINTEAPPTAEEMRVIVRILWGAYIAAIVAACGFFAAFVVTHYWVHSASTLAALLWGWIVTRPLDNARADLHAIRATHNAHRAVAS